MSHYLEPKSHLILMVVRLQMDVKQCCDDTSLIALIVQVNVNYMGTIELSDITALYGIVW